jgi:hypothetical protein
MEIDDRRALAALLATARDILRSRVQPELAGERKLDAAMIANAMGLVARALEHSGTAWSQQGGTAAEVHALRAAVRARLAVANPAYLDQVRDAPP